MHERYFSPRSKMKSSVSTTVHDIKRQTKITAKKTDSNHYVNISVFIKLYGLSVIPSYILSIFINGFHIQIINFI